MVVRTAPPWLWIAALALIAFTGAVVAGVLSEATRLSVSAARLIIEGAAFVWAAGRADAPRRFQQALAITGWTSVVTAVSYALLVPAALGGPTLVTPVVDTLFTIVSYAGAVVALLIYPRLAASARDRVAPAIDLVLTVGGLGVLSWALVTSPSAAQAPGDSYVSVIVYGLAQLSLVAALNVVVVRGLAFPTRRAFWWFVAGQAAYVPVLVLTQFEEAGYVDGRWSSLIYFLGVLPTLVAAACIRRDPIGDNAASTAAPWIVDFNPLPLLTPLAVGAGLLFALVVGPASATVPLATTLLIVSLLLSLRLLLSARHGAALARADAEAERRRQRDKMQAVARLAGGVAHEFNNLMTRVMGHAELGEDLLAPGADARLEFQQIRTAAERAAALTSQLLAFSGRQRARLDRLDLAAWLRGAFPEVVRGLPNGVTADLKVAADAAPVWADAAQLAIAIAQITANAAEAMPDGGRVTIALVRHDLEHTLATPLLRVPAGAYVAVHVRDTGRGIPADDLAAICDPFFSTKAPHLAAGLGLASVYGIVAAHGGGLAVESTVGTGTTISVYLPLA